MALEDVGHCRSGDPVAEVGQRTLNPGIDPARIPSCHADDEVGDLAHDGRPPRSSSLEGPLQSDQLPVPGEDRVWRNECGKLE